MSLGARSRGALRLEDVTRRFGTIAALSGVSLAAEGARFVVLLGPSGCGKSTLLRIVAGLDTQHSGRVLLGGRDVTGLPPKERGVAMVFQNYALFPHLSVAENIVFGLRARGAPRAEREARLARAAGMLGLAQLLHRRPNQLSGGQQQRVALARAVVAEAPICLMDEPLSNLDAKLRAEMRREIRGLQQRLGITMVYVTHDQAEAMSMADQVVLMNEGRIEQDATPAELYARPASLFAASFIGTPPMSLLRLEPGAGGAVIAGTAGPAVAPAEAAGAILGVRPEEIAPTDGPGLAAAVASAEFLGAETVLTCTVGAAGETIQARVPGHHALTAGSPLRLRLPPPVHLFDAATGRRLPETNRRRVPAEALHDNGDAG
ncbi:ABC transporter ATP-binding protein [Elioraea sp. Yellowstone]|jgi:sn-glycerol 3-phosphate transport system ATP-binding protein|nr:ABC transporter ATP-binding protein [Elioraea sp. Yellowstone]TQF76976.1 ABC transporter ATP-binding protein [Elioraea sp. Yellowstone]